MPLFKPDIYVTATPAKRRTLVTEWAARKPPVSLQFEIPGLSRSAVSAFACKDVTIPMYTSVQPCWARSVPRGLGSSHKAYMINSKLAALSTFLDHSLVTGCLLSLN